MFHLAFMKSRVFARLKRVMIVGPQRTDLFLQSKFPKAGFSPSPYSFQKSCVGYVELLRHFSRRWLRVHPDDTG
jgi:hypothetical protein